MRFCVAVILFLISSVVLAQQPRIDSMRIDESKGELSVYGDFGFSKGRVWCDSVELMVENWSSSLVVAIIPDTGKGSAGPVIVEGRNYLSDPRFITMWKGVWSFGYNSSVMYKPNFGSDSLRYIIRLDLSSLLSKKDKILKTNLAPISQLKIDAKWGWSDPHGAGEENFTDPNIVVLSMHDTSYSSGFQAESIFQLNKKIITINVLNIRGISQHSILHNSDGSTKENQTPYPVSDFSLTLVMDSTYAIKQTKDFYDSLNHKTTFTDPLSYSFLPPVLHSLSLSPKLLSPDSASVGIGTEQVNLSWDSLPYMISYHVLYSTDSNFATSINDTISSLHFRLPPLIKNTTYFWRIAGINSEGQSRWSEVWKFTTGNVSSVASRTPQIVSLSVYPNPAKDIVHISYSNLNSMSKLTAYDLCGNLIQQFQCSSTGISDWDVSTLPSGSYVIGLSSGSESRSTIVSIVK